MKKNKKIKQLIKKVVQDIFLNGKLNEKKAQKYLKVFKSLKSYEALRYLQEFQKQLERKIAETTLTIESAVELSPAEVGKIEKVMKQYHTINSYLLSHNPSLIGGLKIKVGDQVYDDSVETKINEVGEVIHG